MGIALDTACELKRQDFSGAPAKIMIYHGIVFDDDELADS